MNDFSWTLDEEETRRRRMIMKWRGTMETVQAKPDKQGGKGRRKNRKTEKRKKQRTEERKEKNFEKKKNQTGINCGVVRRMMDWAKAVELLSFVDVALRTGVVTKTVGQKEG
ncbi:hypothetical protein L249_0175, partial [Ophiocordyceps polyrhachis-furcata BCC 54312]